MWKNLKLATKLYLSFGTIALITLFLGLFGYYGAVKGEQSINEIGKVRLPSVETLLIIKEAQTAIDGAEKALLSANLKAQEREGYYRKISEAEKRAAHARQIYEPLPQTQEEAVVWKEFVPAWDKWVRDHEAFISLSKKYDALLSAAAAEHDSREIIKQMERQVFVTNAGSLEASEKLVDRLVEINDEVAKHEVESAHHFAVRLEAILLIVAISGTLLAMLIAFLITRAISRPLTNAVAVCEELSRGNLTVDIKVDSKDETGQLLAAMKTMVDSLRAMFTDITNGVATLSSSSTELSAIATQLSSNAEDASSRSTGVASAAEEMSTNMSSVSAAMEQSASNVGMVATATEEMSSTVREIAQNAAKAKDISEQAVDQSQQASSKMQDLGQAANKIGKVTEAITEISEQTNLLALNATIEAARAGEAGKGFAVVANEIKELAKQTAAATVDIRNQIEEMQHTTGGAITDIDKIGRVITEINEIVTTIATAVEQQSAATSEISSNIAQASAGIGEVNENVAQSTVAIADITKDITEINNSTGEVNQGGQNVKDSASELSRLAELLNGLVQRFKLA